MRIEPGCDVKVIDESLDLTAVCVNDNSKYQAYIYILYNTPILFFLLTQTRNYIHSSTRLY
jgi:hypothetical protein